MRRRFMISIGGSGLNPGGGIDYYVSSSGSGSGLSSGTPMSQSNFLLTTIAPNDRVFFKRGDTFYFGDYTISTNNVTFSAYGSGARPTFIGSTPLGALTWTSEGGGIYSVPYSTSDFKWLFENGVAAALAESPFYVITNQVSSTILQATSLSGAWGSSVAGAQVLVKDSHYSWSHVRTVASYNGTNQITLDDDINTGLNGYSFKLFNQLQFLTAQYEFFFDDAANKIYYHAGGGSPAGTDVRACNKDVAFIIGTGVSGVTITGLEFTEYFEAAVKGQDNDNFTFTDNDVNNIRTDGIFLYGENTGSAIDNNTFTKCGLNGVYTGALDNFSISGNTITTIGRERTLPFPSDRGVGFSFYQQECATGIAQTWDETNPSKVPLSGIYEGNVISDCGYIGILFLGSDHTISNNHVYDVMKDFEDGAGIYTINHPEAPYGGQGDNNLIEFNNIHDLVGNAQYTSGSTGEALTYGIYIDINVTDCFIENNTISKCTTGTINVNYGCANNTFDSNLLVGGLKGLRFVDFESQPLAIGTNTGNVVTNNTFIIAGSPNYAISVEDIDGTTTYNPFSGGGSSDNNYFINPYSTTLNARLTGSDVFYTLAAWQAAYSVDAASTQMTNFITYTSAADSDEEVVVIHNATDSVTTTNVPAGYSGFKNIAGTTITSSTQNVPAHGGFPYLSIAGSKNVRFINHNTGAFSTALNASVSTGYPTSIIANDLLILWTFTPSGSCTVATPAGWTLLHNDVAGGATNNFYTKVATGSESGSFNVTFTGANLIPKLTRIFHFRFNATSSFTEDSKTTISSGTTLTGPSLTSTQRWGLAVSFISFYNSTPAIGAYSGATQTWFEIGTDYSPHTSTGTDLNITELRTVSSVSGGTITTGAAGATTRSFIIKNIVP